MNSKYFFISLFNRRKIIILLIFQAIVYTFFLMNFFSTIMFKYNFINDREKSFPIENGAYIDELNLEQMIDNKKGMLKFIDYIEKNKKIKNYSMHTREMLDAKEYNVDTSNFKAQYREMERDFQDTISLYKINYGYYKQIEGNIDGEGFKQGDFEDESEYIPVILGSSFKEIYNIGDVITNEIQQFKVIGFFKKDILFMKSEPISNVEKSSKCFVVPLTNNYMQDDCNFAMSMKKMTFYFVDNQDNESMINELQEKSKEYGLDFKFSNFKDKIDKFIPQVESQLLFEIMRVGIFTLLSLGVFTLSLIYLISNRKREIGILYSLGATSWNIIFMAALDIIFVITISYIISIPIYIYFGNSLSFGFINNYNIWNLGMPFIILIVLSLISLILPISNIIKLKPNELIRGN